MKYTVIDYKATDPVEIVSFKGYNNPTDIPEQAADVARVTLQGLGDVMSLGEPLSAALAKFKGVAADPEAIWASIVGGPKPKEDVPVAPKAEKKSASKRTKKAKVELQSAPADGNPASVAGEPGEGSKEKIMAKAKVKKASKKVAKVKKATGTKTGPRGEKTLKVKAMLERKSGCTRAQVLEMTGWPAVSMQAMAAACGLKLKKIKEPGKATIYFGT